MGEEQFEVFDEAGALVGLVARSEVHRLGLWHRSAHVFLYNTSAEMLIQKRSQDKDLYAGLWDYAVGEHLQPGETFEAGALRGLREELGVAGVALTEIGTVRRFRFETAQGAIDAEEQQAFRCVHDGPFEPDPVEVAQIEFVSIEDLAGDVTAHPSCYTPWFVRDLTEFGLL
ncbi:MAG: NUDIX domain-containing protein [Pseudomonadales bacterium]|nr:NUDIX domain-containing protein [Pseudomonadales bacterium]MDP6472679.1 NUDIX domain-containing protein [Pseudomonadales bacterium]MDP6827891.1 NUDIX domain-containing protein [Pseudomonadales bacterium]MDP6972699.1 NUDIX domain-containing protein [Pseudomonadales bacterium]